MRKDMNKVLVGRPRVGMRRKTRRNRLSGPDDLPTKIGVRRYVSLTHTSSKGLNENLSPLRRYLWRQRGRPWDKVNSEMRAVMDDRNEVQAHIMTHVEDIIVLKVHIDKRGRWLAQSRSWGGVAHTPERWWQKLYVDPRDGIIKETAKLCRKQGRKPWKWNYPTPEPDAGFDRRVLSDTMELRQENGVWYEFTLGKVSTAKSEDLSVQWLEIPNAPEMRYRSYAKPTSHWRPILKKRQLNGADLKRHGLTNSTN